MARNNNRGGRGRGRNSRGRGGRGGGSNSNSSSNTASSPKIKKLEDHVYYIGSARQASDFDTTTEFLINHIKKEFEKGGADIAKALEDLEHIDFSKSEPVLELADVSDPNRDLLNKQNELKFKEQYGRWMSKKDIYIANKSRAYALLWERCSQGMQQQIQERDTFASTIKDDPVELLKAIKQHALNYKEHRYEMSIVSDALKTWLLSRQKEGESLTTFTKRYRTAVEVLMTHLGGPVTLNKYVENTEAYKNLPPDDIDSAGLDKLFEEAFEMLVAYVYMENSDQAKYGSLLQSLASQQSLKNDQYPKTMVDATQALSNHKLDNAGKKKENSKKNDDSRQQNESSTQSTQQSTSSSTPDVPALSFAQLENRCHVCGGKGHFANKCKHKSKIPEAEWAITKAKKIEARSYAQVASEDGNQSDDADSIASRSSRGSSRVIAWNSAQIRRIEGVQMFLSNEFPSLTLRDVFLLDNESSSSIMGNEDLVFDIQTSKSQLDLSTNGGQFEARQDAIVPGFWKRTWFDKSAMANIFAFHEMAKQYRITYDNTKEDAFTVHMAKPVKFTLAVNGLYIYVPTDKYRAHIRDLKALPIETSSALFAGVDSVDATTPKTLKEAHPGNKAGVSLVQTLKENKQGFSDRQIERAKLARDLFHNSGVGTPEELRQAISANGFKNNPVTVEDVIVAQKYFGPDVDVIKGKATRTTPPPVTNEYIEIPQEIIMKQEQIILCIDGNVLKPTT